MGGIFPGPGRSNWNIPAVSLPCATAVLMEESAAQKARAAAGGYAGNKIQQKVQQGDTYTTTEQQCATVYDRSEVPAGYEVVYVLNGKEHHVHMDHDPGKRIPVKDGHIITDSDAKPEAS